MKNFLFIFFCLLSISFYGQTTELFVKAGISINGTSSTEFGRYDNGSHYAYGPSSGYSINSINDGKLKYCSPYASLGIYHKGKKWFGFYTGVTYTQYKQSFNYSSYNIVSFGAVDTLHEMHYNEYDDNGGKGSIINNVFRFEFTPVIFFKKTKISFPFINLDFVIPQIQTNVNVQREYYQKVASLYGSGYGIASSIPTGSQQNVPLSINKNDFSYPTGNNYESMYQTQTLKQVPFIFVPLSMKVEQAIIIAGTKWLIGGSAIWSPKARYYGFNFYVGYCIWSSTKMPKEN